MAVQDPVLALLNAYAAYQRGHGGQQDPLAARATPAQSMAPADRGNVGGGVRLLTGAGGAEPVQVTQQGARAGQARQSYDLGDGRVAHVYYTPGGKRKVFVFRPQAPAA